MEMLEHLRKRRSIRRFLPRPIDDDKIAKLITAATLSPSARNRQPWKFFVVKNKDTIIKLSKTQPYSAFLKGAQAVIVVAVDEKISENHFVEDGSIAALSILLEATDLGLGACWNAVYYQKDETKEEYVRGVLNIPKNYRIICNIGLGYPDEKTDEKEIKALKDIIEVIE